ncbi:MAG: transketolase family protein [Rhodospirillaceae bacterium]
MRNAFADEVTALAQSQDNLVLLSGDIGNRLFDKFKDVAGARFINCGVAEANMMSVASGLAMSGLRPIAYTITPFVTTRCLEQIRDDVCYQNVPVIIVGVGSGLGYASLGPTHHSCEDVAFLRALPNMTVTCPGDALEVRAILRRALEHDGPIYLRLGKKNEPVIHDSIPDISLGKGLLLRKGNDVSLFSTGTTLPLAVEVTEALASHGIKVRLVSLHTVKPLDTAMMELAFSETRLVITLEEHSLIGGLGAAFAEWIADRAPLPARLYRVGTRDEFFEESGDLAFARLHFGITKEDIVAGVLARVGVPAN